MSCQVGPPHCPAIHTHARELSRNRLPRLRHRIRSFVSAWVENRLLPNRNEASAINIRHMKTASARSHSSRLWRNSCMSVDVMRAAAKERISSAFDIKVHNYQKLPNEGRFVRNSAPAEFIV